MPKELACFYFEFWLGIQSISKILTQFGHKPFIAHEQFASYYFEFSLAASDICLGNSDGHSYYFGFAIFDNESKSTYN